jgi:hypothetical protein
MYKAVAFGLSAAWKTGLLIAGSAAGGMVLLRAVDYARTDRRVVSETSTVEKTTKH